MNRALAGVIITATACATLSYVTKRFFDALEAGPTEYIDTVDLPPELERDSSQLLAIYRDDYLGWNE